MELEQLLAETGKLTEAIAVCNRAIQDDPNNAEAYDRLGWALSQQGYLAEAISAYNQALRVNPTLAEAHNHLGLALSQQGNTREAIRAYSRAIQLKPNLEEAHRNLDVALRKQGVYPANGSPQNGYTSFRPMGQAAALSGRPGPATRPPASNGSTPSTAVGQSLSPDRPQTQSSEHSKRRSLALAGAGTVGLTGLLLGGWLLYGQLAGSLPKLLAGQPTPSIENIRDLKQASTPVVTLVAARQLNQGDIQVGERAIEVLLDRGALTQTATALTPILNKEADDPIVNFLMGRLAWQFVQSGNRLYTVEDARQSWEKAARIKPTVLNQNALGFAYYAEGQLDRASQAWLQALQTAGEGPDSTAMEQTAVSTQDSLTAYAGLALISMKKAEKEPPRKGAILQSEAINLRQRVLMDDPVNFQPKALRKNWLWSEQTIKEWETLLSLKRK